MYNLLHDDGSSSLNEIMYVDDGRVEVGNNSHDDF